MAASHLDRVSWSTGHFSAGSDEGGGIGLLVAMGSFVSRFELDAVAFAPEKRLKETMMMQVFLAFVRDNEKVE